MIGIGVVVALLAIYLVVRYGGFAGGGEQEDIVEGSTNRWRIGVGPKKSTVVHVVYPEASEVTDLVKEFAHALGNKDFCLLKLNINNLGGTAPTHYTVAPPMVHVLLKDGTRVHAIDVRERAKDADLSSRALRRFDATEVVPQQSELLMVLFERFFKIDEVRAIYWGTDQGQRMKRE